MHGQWYLMQKKLRFLPVDTELVSLPYYEAVVRQQAAAERMVQDSIKENPGVPAEKANLGPRYETTRTDGVSVDFGAIVECTYPVYDASWLRVEFGANVISFHVPVGGRTFAAYFSAASSWPASN